MGLFFDRSILLEKKLPKTQANDYSVKDDMKDKKAGKDTSSEDPDEVQPQANDYSAGNDVKAEDDTKSDDANPDDTANDYSVPDDAKEDDTQATEEDNPDDTSSDYSLPNDDEDNTDDSGDAETDDSGDGSGDQPNDYSLDGDNASDDSGDGTDEGSGDDTGEEGTDDTSEPSDPIKDLETKIFGNLSAQKNKLKDRELGRRFNEMYISVSDIMSRLDLVPKTEVNLKTIEFCSAKIMEVKELMFNYITYTYSSNSYLQNLEQFYLFLATLNKVQEMLAEVIQKDDSKERQ